MTKMRKLHHNCPDRNKLVHNITFAIYSQLIIFYGIGAVATQSFFDPAYGPLSLALMRSGKTADQALEDLLTSNPGQEVRQELP